MKYVVTIGLGFMLLMTRPLLAQPGASDHSPRPAYDRLESYKKVRMLESLNLNEDQSAKFIARYNKHAETMHGFEKERNELVDKLDTQSRSDAGDADYDQTFNVLLDIDKQISGERFRFLTELKEVLSNKQIAQYIVFERNFAQELRQAVRDVQRERMKDH
ncbi:MAG: hypothetical protein WBZ48_03680 [Bacteroidota bacterium]